MAHIRSRILEHLPEKCILALDRIRESVTIYHNNDKIEKGLQILNEYDVDYVKIGTGTNRLAILIDNYIFKIAMDDEGVRDNRNEFVMSPMETPRVLKTYETNGLISVSEYVTLITMEEFSARSSEILEILEELSQKYLFGDIGFLRKNFQNWGYRSDGSLVILDYAYMYPIFGYMMACPNCGKVLHYNKDYSKLVCSNCGKTFSFWDIRKRIDMKRIDRLIDEELSRHLRTSVPLQEISDEIYEDHLPYDEERGGGEATLYSKVGKEEYIMSLKKERGYESPMEYTFDESSYGDSAYSSFSNLNRAIMRDEGRISAEEDPYDDTWDEEEDEADNPMIALLAQYETRQEKKEKFASYVQDYHESHSPKEEESSSMEEPEELLPIVKGELDLADHFKEARQDAIMQAIQYLQGKGKLPEVDSDMTKALKELRTSLLAHGKKQETPVRKEEEKTVPKEPKKESIKITTEIPADAGETMVRIAPIPKEQPEAMEIEIAEPSQPTPMTITIGEEALEEPPKNSLQTVDAPKEERQKDSVSFRAPTPPPEGSTPKKGGYFQRKR